MEPKCIPGLGRSPGEGNGNPFQYSCLENSTPVPHSCSPARGNPTNVTPTPVPSAVPAVHQVSRASNSITVSWPQPDQTNGNILDYQLRYYDQVGSRGRPWCGWWEVPGAPQWGEWWGDRRGASGP